MTKYSIEVPIKIEIEVEDKQPWGDDRSEHSYGPGELFTAFKAWLEKAWLQEAPENRPNRKPIPDDRLSEEAKGPAILDVTWSGEAQVLDGKSNPVLYVWPEGGKERRLTSEPFHA